MRGEFDIDNQEVKVELLAVLHGSVVPCDNSKYPAIYTRITNPRLQKWIFDNVFGKEDLSSRLIASILFSKNLIKTLK